MMIDFNDFNDIEMCFQWASFHDKLRSWSLGLDGLCAFSSMLPRLPVFCFDHNMFNENQ